MLGQQLRRVVMTMLDAAIGVVEPEELGVGNNDWLSAARD
jgi:hypothetical protein